MPESTFRARQQAHTPEIKASVWLLRVWSRHGGDNQVYVSYAAALRALADRVRRDWPDHAWLSGLPETPTGLTDGAAVSLFYNLPIEEAPILGKLYDGFDIVDHEIHGQTPATVNQRRATFAVVNEHLDSAQRAGVTYRLDALGLAITLTTAAHGPVVTISNERLSTGTAITVIADDFEEQAQ